ncbi:TRAP transporter small permease [Treponema pectinovorum]|uniref:TRAP transporter small permease n=1 Tax=Treponema pectinovorum TaxID=164 RepID=UPI0011C85502|nr:TRAP transporter small permease [Treponema pectinovorum]
MNKIINGLFKGIEAVIAIFLAVMITLVFANVVLRYLFNKGFAWSEEVARLCFIYLVYLGSIEAAKDNKHLLIDSILIKLPGITQKLVYILIQLIIIYLMYLMTFGSYGLMIQNLHDKWVATQFPIWGVYLSGLFLGISIIIISVINIVRLIFLKAPVSELIAATKEDDPLASAE